MPAVSGVWVTVMTQALTMIYWKSERFWLGKFVERPDIMTQGETLEELEENLRDAWREMVFEDVPQDFQTKSVVV